MLRSVMLSIKLRREGGGGVWGHREYILQGKRSRRRRWRWRCKGRSKSKMRKKWRRKVGRPFHSSLRPWGRGLQPAADVIGRDDTFAR